MQIRSLGQEDPLEAGLATHSSVLAWRILWTEKPGGLQSIGCRVNHTEAAWHACTASTYCRSSPLCRTVFMALHFSVTVHASGKCFIQNGLLAV